MISTRCGTLYRMPYYRMAVHAAIFILAFWVRLHFVQQVDWFAVSDTRDFHEYALNLLRGEGFVNYWNESSAREGFVSRQMHSVGYPLFLAGAYYITGFDAERYANSPMPHQQLGAAPWPAEGFNPHAILKIQIILDLITMTGLILMATRLFGFPAAVLTQLFYTFYVSWTPQLISETLFISLFISAITLLVFNSDFQSRRRTALFSLIAVLAVMTKPIAIILYAFPALWFLRQPSRTHAIRVMAMGLPLLLFVSVMFARSYHYYGHAFISSTGAQHVATHNYGFDWVEEHERIRETLGRVPNEWELMNHFRTLKKRVDREEPLRAVRIYFQSMRQMFSWEPDWHMHWLWRANYHQSPEAAQQHQILFALSLFAYPLGLFGMIILCRRAWIPATACILFLLLHAAVSPGHHRYMAPVNVLFILFSAALLTTAGQWMMAKIRKGGDSPCGTTGSPASNRGQ